MLLIFPFILSAELIATSSLAASAETESQVVAPIDLTSIYSFEPKKLSLSTEAEVSNDQELHIVEKPTFSSFSNYTRLAQKPENSDDSPNSQLLRIDEEWSEAEVPNEQEWHIVEKPTFSGFSNSNHLAQVEPYSSESDSLSSPLVSRDELNSDASLEPDVMAQVTSVSQLTDVQPTDWAFQALQSLVERYDCIQGYPNKTYRGNRSLTRYEFAAGVNTCLNRMNELIAIGTAELVRKQDLLAVQKLQKEFATELATLRNRVDAVEVSTSTLEQQQFSTTTKLVGEAVFAPVKVFGNDSDKNNTVLQERVFLSLVTSFTGLDQLTTVLAAGNTPINTSAFNLPGVTLGGVLPVSTAEGTLIHQSGGNFNNTLNIYAVEYRFPVGDRVTAFLEGYGGVTYYVAPTFNPYLDYQDFGKGAISAFGQRSPIYRLGSGSGIGLNYKLTDQITLSGVYLSDLFTANNPIPEEGLFQSGYTALGQISWNPSKNFGIGLTYVNSYFLPGEFGFNNYGGLQLTGTAVANTLAGKTSLNLISQPSQPVVMNSYGVELSYQFSPKFAISGWFGASYPRLINTGDGEILYYALTLNFPDFARKGNLLAFVLGAEPYLTHFNSGNPQPFKTDIPLHIEALYQYQLTPNISLTPGLVWLTAPNQDNRNGSDLITTLRATFTF
ncbi:MAG: iron uptake porin [Rhizonema sp. PD37]|nr:iron uptake porin [Rhizonema sp. PD37]